MGACNEHKYEGTLSLIFFLKCMKISNHAQITRSKDQKMPNIILLIVDIFSKFSTIIQGYDNIVNVLVNKERQINISSFLPRLKQTSYSFEAYKNLE